MVMPGVRTVILSVGITSTVFLFVFYNTMLPPQNRTNGELVGKCDSEQFQETRCECDRTLRSPRHKTFSSYGGNQISSSCDEYSTSRGGHQNVLSFTLFGKPYAKTSNIYYRGVELVVRDSAVRYPGWLVRLYHNVDTSDGGEVKSLCRLWCRYSHLDICDARKLPYPLCDRSKVYGAHWRFLPMGDPLVDRFISRDLDSPILKREVDAVNEWIKSNKTFHLMRDHPYHKEEIMAGMWGAVNSDLNLTRTLRERFLSDGLKWQSGMDQTLLTKIVWPVAVNDSVHHSSYLCEKFPNTSPFPTKRENLTYVGMIYPWRITYLLKNTCPQICRPTQHPDWIYC